MRLGVEAVGGREQLSSALDGGPFDSFSSSCSPRTSYVEANVPVVSAFAVFCVAIATNCGFLAEERTIEPTNGENLAWQPQLKVMSTS